MEALDSTHLLMLLGVFAIVFVVVFGMMFVFAPRDMRRRIAQAGGTNTGSASSSRSTSAQLEEPPSNDWIEKIAEFSQPISRLSIPKEGWEGSALRIRLMNAGWRTPSAAGIFFAAKTALAIFFPICAAIVMYSTSYQTSTSGFWSILSIFTALGYYLPNVVLARRVAWRQRAVFEDFPDSLDLLTVCVEAGLGLDAALMKVAAEMQLSSPVVASELEIMLLEMRSGFSKEKALRNFSLRTGVEDIDSFSTMLIQAERFGTSVGASLRVLSDTLRTRRRMRAEEQAAKISLKLLFPLMVCIFPALFVVLAGPAFINIYRTLLPSMAGGG